MPQKERWGILIRKDAELARKETVYPKDLIGMPLLMVKRELVKNELASWFGDYYEKMQVAATYNLIVNAAAMVKTGIGAALCFDFGMQFYDDLCFVPLTPRLETGSFFGLEKESDDGCSC